MVGSSRRYSLFGPTRISPGAQHNLIIDALTQENWLHVARSRMVAGTQMKVARTVC